MIENHNRKRATMTNLFDITDDDIVSLDDSQLRELIGLLCEAEFRNAKMSTSGVTWGGDQNAPDGGIDVDVKSENIPQKHGYIPRPYTGFQVKKPDLGPAAIMKEMKPHGILRESIKELISNNGAYVIISSKAKKTDGPYKNSIKAMKEAVSIKDPNGNLHVDFYDRGKIASWVRSHPSLILHVHQKIGRNLNGWRPYESWAKSPKGLKDPFLMDEDVRIHDDSGSSHPILSIAEGINRIRDVLSQCGSSVRLIGLSGVGKTRLVQALFDERVGSDALNRNYAYYTDSSSNPTPDPESMVKLLTAHKTRAVLVIDNCSPELHRKLTEACSVNREFVSVLTVEYDVRDDLPDETQVFRLEPASEKIIEMLLKIHCPDVNPANAHRIAVFSGGNARIALSLGKTLKRGDTLAGIRDEDLFKRLFYQRKSFDEELMKSAEVCSLVYSFQGTETEAGTSELSILASLIDKSVSDLFRDVTELNKRDLIQSRSVWRAVLPHALANRLASQALESIPKDKIVLAFMNCGSERLIKSFSRRLGYLHDSQAAVEIAEEWLSPNGWLGSTMGDFNVFGIEIFKNIAPVSPEKTLEMIERCVNGKVGSRFTSNENSHSHEFVAILKHIAYDPVLFERSVAILTRFALFEKATGNNSIREKVKSLFYLYCSGTHASVDSRAAVIKSMACSDNEEIRGLAFLFLKTSLATTYFGNHFDHNFGARPRDYGYAPKTPDEMILWYKTFIGLCSDLAVLDNPLSKQARIILAGSLRGLWRIHGLNDFLEQTIKQIHKQRAWTEGWVSVREILYYHGKSPKKNEDAIERLELLESHLKPESLLEKARALALLNPHDPYVIIDEKEDHDESFDQLCNETFQIAIEIANDLDMFQALLPDLVSTDNRRLLNFGKGLANGCSDKHAIWEMMRNQLEKTPEHKRNISIFKGFIGECADNDPSFFDSTLDRMITDDLFAKKMPYFQIDTKLDHRGIARLFESLDNDTADLSYFSHLAWTRPNESINDDDMAVLLEKILSKPGGMDVVCDIISHKYCAPEKEFSACSDSLKKMVYKALSTYLFTEDQRLYYSLDYKMSLIAQKFLSGSNDRETAYSLCQNLADAFAENRTSAYNYKTFLDTIARIQPFVYLDTFLEYLLIKYRHKPRWLYSHIDEEKNPLCAIPHDTIISWCDQKPSERYPMIASMVHVFATSCDSDNPVLYSLIYSILNKSQELNSVLTKISVSISRSPVVYGSLADIFEKRSMIFKTLEKHDDPGISDWATKEMILHQKRIEDERRREINFYKVPVDERFE